MKTIARWLLLIAFVAGCTGPLEPGRLPTAQELCAIQGGFYLGDVCHTSGGQ